jgi:uncharacterized repeat protein (TIGR01451 family)
VKIMRVAVSRRGWWACWFLAGSAVLGAAWWGQHGGVAGPSDVPSALAGKESGAAQALIAQQPLAFEPNRGQSDGRVLFLSRNPGYSLFLTAQGAVLGLNGVAQPLSFSWQGASAKSHPLGVAVLPTRHNYLRGKDPRRWQRDVPTYEKVRYPNLYPGIDLVYYGRQQHLEYDLVVAPGADPAAIRLQLAGMDGLRVDKDGALRFQVADRALTLSKPVIYQETATGKQVVAGGYVLLADNQVGLKLASYDRGKPLVIDPVLSYSSYLGGSGLDQGKGVAVDGAGNIYVVGQTASADFPKSGKTSTDTDAFVAKFNAGGTLQFATYLGGSGTDRGFAIAMDNANAAVYIVGDTDSADFPIKSASQSTPGGDLDGFVAKFNSADLTLGFATYLGGSRAEEALGVAVDGSGNAYVAGATLSADFPITVGGGAFNAGSTGDNCDDPSHPGTAIPCSDAYVVKYDAGGVKQYATFLGGYFEDAATAIAVNGGGEAYLTGITYSTSIDFPVTSNAFQQNHAGGFGDAYILKLDSAGSVSYGTYLGGGGWDQGQAIAVDGGGNVYVAGATNSGSSTSSAPLPLTNALQQQYGGGSYDAFVAKVTPANAPSSQLRYLTYLGGGGKDFAFGIAVDGSGNAYVVGETTSTDFPLDTPLQSIWFGSGQNNWGDAFIAKIDKAGYFLNWSTYLGGGDDDWANSVALDGSGGIYVAGSSFSADFPIENPFQPSSAGNGDALLFKLSDSPITADLQVAVSAAPDPVGSGETLTYQVVVSNLSASNAAGGVVTVATLPGGISFSSASPAGSCSASGAQVTCTVGAIAAGGSVTTALQTVSNTAGDITFTAKVARANQPDPNPANDSASVTTTAAVGSSGGGAWSLLEWLATMIIYVVRRRRGVVLSSI